MSLESLVYVSLTTNDRSDVELKGMLKKVREKINNQALLVNTLYQDPRHKDVLLIYKKPIQDHSFAKWAMDFNKEDNLTLECLDGFCDFMQDPTRSFFMQRASEAEAFLNEFKHQTFF